MHGSFHAPLHGNDTSHERARSPSIRHRGRPARVRPARQRHRDRVSHLSSLPEKMVTAAVTSKKVEVTDLRLSYGSKEDIHGISFHIEPNEIFGIIGPAQSGKTSLLRCINRTVEFAANAKMSGSIKVD